MGLGSLSKVPLAHARAAAQECRKLLGSGLDPVAEQNAERERATLEAAKAITFLEAAERYIAAHQGKWRNEITPRNGTRPSRHMPDRCLASCLCRPSIPAL